MHHNNQFVKKTKKGQIRKVVREHYLRDDIWSGTPLDEECEASAHKLSASASHYLVIDTNIALHQLDFLEHPAITDVVVCSVVLEEVRHKNSAAYQRLRALCASDAKRFYVFANEHHRETFIKSEAGESPNDRNDRAIRVATKWYADRLAGRMEVILLTNDSGSRRLAEEEGVRAIGAASYVRLLRPDATELLDMVAAGTVVEEDPEEEDGGAPVRSAKRKRIYEEHKTFSEVQAGIREGRFHQGALRVNRYNPYEGYVGSDSVGQDILLAGRSHMNRAMDGDIVAVELLPESEWRGPSSKLPGQGKATGGGSDAAEEEGNEEEDVGAGAEPEVFQVGPPDDPSVLAQRAGEEAKQPTGRVVGIISRNWRSRGYCGSLKPPSAHARPLHGASNVLFLPVERRYPAIRIQTRQADSLMDKRLVVAIDSWPSDSTHPLGHYVRTLGTIGDKDTETEVVLIENDINTSPFTPAVHECVPTLPWRVTEDHLAQPGRTDLRHLPVCSVDPPGCKDIDDALHVRPLPNGNYELGVHIADVTNFLRPGSAMDVEAAARATTTYLVQRRIDMLPKPLTEDICSLRGGEERLTFSVLWEVNDNAEIQSTKFTKGVIKSRAALQYAEAQSRIDDPRLQDEITLSLRTMNKLAKILRRRRAERGALQLASPEVKFTIDTETHDPLDVGMYQVQEANQMVEEMMLLANVSVAEAIAHHFPSCSLLRRHPVPAPRQFEPILQAAAAVGLTLDVSTSKSLAESLDAAVRPEDPYFNKLVRILSTRCMTQALYFCSGDHAPHEFLHYGLASPIYTHFTSPIRRYADVMVHRLLAAVLQLESLPETARDREGLRAGADNLNKRHRNAQLAGRASVELHTLIFFKDRTVHADARVTKVKANGLIVFVPKYGIEGPVYLTPRADGNSNSGPSSSSNNKAVAESAFVLDEKKQTVVSRDGSVRYRVFDPCAVRIHVEEGYGHRRQLVLELISREQLQEAEQMVA
ncbi:hypothetical protein DUNSADRAFT_18006 [Dunaliella salina]|uniref:Uncharacterized protein n=1 Tax=Dunaliella salina TaxID=3046 RepID=A0ABQ7G0U5_DUNSA|nr:hypothetical protein DUNSADRAFT_18006 [Dunaliella salina]|eukprot:KAF5828225.1 hypothetical protein DUNSADRAFT_18006 [Dunaliella salina]